MTVEELITKLKKHEPSMPVVVETMEGNEIDDLVIDEAFGTVILKEF